MNPDELIFWRAAKNGHTSEVVQQLSSNPGLNVNWSNPKDTGSTPLHIACRMNYAGVVSALLSHPAINVNQKDDRGRTPFLLACSWGSVPCVRLLLQDSRVHVNEKSTRGRTPLYWAAVESHMDVMRRWIVSGREIDFEGIDQMLTEELAAPRTTTTTTTTTATAADSGSDLSEVVMLRRQRLMAVSELLGKFRASPGPTREVIQGELDRPEPVEVLLRRLNDAAFFGFTDQVQAIVAAHPDLDINWRNPNYDDFTALVSACARGHVAAADLILAHPRIDLMVNEDGFRALLKACAEGFPEVVALLLRRPELDVNQRGSYTCPLVEACGHNRVAVVQYLLNHPDIDVNLRNNNGETPFYRTCSAGILESVQVLLQDHRVLVNEPDEFGDTPLWIAASKGFLDIIKWWIASGREIYLGEPGNIRTDAIWEAKKTKMSLVVALLEAYKLNPAHIRQVIRRELGVL